MPKQSPPKNHYQRWTRQEVCDLQSLAKGNTPTKLIALKLRRTPTAVQQKASQENISLMPTNQSPYNRRKS